MSNPIQNRSEILFLYEVENTNPNGDPLNENRPRYDEEDSKILVSDVRLKRTIRDYWYDYKGFNGKGENQDIFVRSSTYQEKGKEYLKDAKKRAEDFENNAENILNKCIDIRVFGGVIPLENDSITFTGPTQFQMGKSLHKAEIEEIQGTGAFASGEGKSQNTFRTEYVVPYALIGFNGIINEVSAKETKMNEEDKKLLLEGIWEGTKQLISRSKFGQKPMLLLVIDYKEPFYIGQLRRKVQLTTDKEETKIRSPKDYEVDLSLILKELEANQNKIKHIEFRVDPELRIKGKEAFEKFVNKINTGVL